MIPFDHRQRDTIPVEFFSAHDVILFLAALGVGLAGSQVAFRLLPSEGGQRRALFTLLSGIALGGTAWAVFLLSLDGFFPFLSASLPVGATLVAVSLCVAGAVGAMAATVYGGRGARDILLAGSLLASAASCALFVVMSGLTAPLELGYDLTAVLGAMVLSTALFGLGLRRLKRSGDRRGRALAAILFGVTLPALNLASLAAILPFSEWVAASATPGALALQPLTVVFVSELIAGLLLVRAGAAVDRQQATRTEQENARLRQLADCTFEGILVHRAGLVLDANSAFCVLAGLPLEAIIGRAVTALAPDFTVPDGAARPVELELHRADGGCLPVEMLSRELSYGDGAALVTAVRDITERRAAEQNARDRRHVADLQREAEELRERARIAAETSRAKSAFLAMMSHEIRTPMNAVLGLATALLEDDLADEQRRMVSAIRESGESLLRILNDILDFSKLDAGRLTFEPIPFSPATLTQEAVSVHGPAAMAKGVNLHAETDPDLPAMLLGDAGRIRQVLMNLVSNAVKFTDAGEVAIRTRCLGRLGTAVRVRWEVQDTGIGVPPDKLARLFDEFVQADDSITRRFGGSGLGLAISRRIVEQMGGEISVDSQLGAGSLFRFSLTLQQAAALKTAAGGRRGDHAEALRALSRKLGRKLRLLLAEDNPTNQFVMEQLLRGFDIVLDVEADGRAAVAAAAANRYDAIFMDMRMPEMDGLAATRAIRRLGGPAATVPVIALTANAFPGDVKACLAAGMTHFVAKPVASDVLFQALVDALSAPQEAGPPAPPGSEAGHPAPAIDTDALGTLLDVLGQDTVRRMVEIFESETEARLHRLGGTPADAAALREEMHTLKGAAITVGAPRLSALAGAAETRLKQDGTAALPELPALSAAFDAFRQAAAGLDLRAGVRPRTPPHAERAFGTTGLAPWPPTKGTPLEPVS
jgi:hypothetical protein